MGVTGMQNYVFVQNGDGRPLSPCHPAVARKLLKKGKAKVVRVVPFTIRLKVIKPNPIVQPTTLSIDDGARKAGIVVVQHNQKGDRVVFKGEINLRNNVKSEISKRRSRRLFRRSRLRKRQPRNRRGEKKGFLPPSVKVRKDNVLRAVRDLASLLPISRIVYEEGQFDIRALWDEEVVDYRQGPNSGFENRKKAVLWRDHYTCAYCGVNCVEAGLVAEVDHIIPKSRGGTWAWCNLVCACRPCNRAKGDRTAAEFGRPEVRGKTFSYPAWLQQGKRYLKKELEKIAPLEVVYGWQTSERRKRLGLKKSHINDCLSLAVSRQRFSDCLLTYTIIARRRRQDMHNLRHREGYAGFRHLDLVVWERRDGYRHLGTVRSFVPARNVVKCRFDFNDNYGVSANRLRLIHRPGSIVYVPQRRKEEGSQTGT
jgi:hypothetical protein